MGQELGVGPEVLERIHRDDGIEHPVPQRHGANVTSDGRDALADSGGLEHRPALLRRHPQIQGDDLAVVLAHQVDRGRTHPRSQVQDS